jgi:hypothetical protein
MMDQKFAEQLVEDCRQRVRDGDTELMTRLVVHLADQLLMFKHPGVLGASDTPVAAPVYMSDDAKRALSGYPSANHSGE